MRNPAVNQKQYLQQIGESAVDRNEQNGENNAVGFSGKE